jgi:hypothetical protein
VPSKALRKENPIRNPPQRIRDGILRPTISEENLLADFLRLQTRAHINRTVRTYRAAGFNDMLDLSITIHHKRRPVREKVLIVQDPVRLGHIALHVAQQWEANVYLFCESSVGRRCVDANSEYCGVVQIYFLVVDTSLVSL